jgi:hypothetical protein
VHQLALVDFDINLNSKSLMLKYFSKDSKNQQWSKSTFEAKSIKELMRLTEEFEAENK